MLYRVLDGDLPPNDKVQQLVAQVVSALPALVMSYSSAEGPDVQSIRKLTDDCFCMARSGGKDLAEGMPHAREVISSSAGITGRTAVSEALTH